jgi:hypothetical protein
MQSDFMSVLSAVLRIAGGIVFGLFLVLAVISNAMAQFTEHDNLQPVLVGVISEQLPAPNASEFAEAKTELMARCAGRESMNLAEVFEGAPDVTVGCADAVAATSGAELVQLAAAAMFDAIYYKRYACAFLDCVTTLPDEEKAMVLASAHANAFFKDATMGAVILALVGIALIAVAIRRPFGIAKAVGIAMTIVGIVTYVGMNVAKGMLPAEVAGGAIGPIVQGLIGTMLSGFLFVLGAGIILAATGFAGERAFERRKPGKRK